MRSARVVTFGAAVCLFLSLSLLLGARSGMQAPRQLTEPRSLGRVEPAPTQIDIDCDAGGGLDALPLSAAPFPGLARFAEPAGDDDDDDDNYVQDAVAPIVINISGTCETGLVIRRDNVTLRGQSAASTILRGRTDADGLPTTTVIEARNVRNLVIEDLTIANGFVGVLAAGADVTVNRAVIRDNRVGLAVIAGGLLTATDSMLHSNFEGGFVEHSANFVLRGSDVSSNVVRGIGVFGNAQIVDTRLEGNTPLIASLGGQVLIAGASRIEAPTLHFGVVAAGGAQIQVVFGELVFQGARINLIEGASWTIASSATVNLGATPLSVREGSLLTVAGTLHGTVTIDSLSRGVVTGTASGSLSCSTLGDVVCPGGTVSSSNCPGCPHAAAAGAAPEALTPAPPVSDRLRELLGSFERMSTMTFESKGHGTTPADPCASPGATRSNPECW